jgi:hypothetical protein
LPTINRPRQPHGRDASKRQKKAAFKNSFEDISGSSFRLVSEGSTDAKVIGRVITKYTHPRAAKW